MKTAKVFLLLITILSLSTTAQADKLPVYQRAKSGENLYELFCNPDNRHRPYVRWWWNGSKIEAKEILRELDIMKAAGIAGVEINTISFPGEADAVGLPTLPWLSQQWLDMFNIAAQGCKERGMVCDMIVGSGWPAGAEFLPREKQSQMLTVATYDVDGGQNGKTFSIGKDEILASVNPSLHSPSNNAVKELMYLRLMPKRVDKFTEGVYFDDRVRGETISVEVPAGEYVLYCFVKLTGFMNVIEGVEGGRGPVLNHFDRSAVDAFLNKTSDIMKFNAPALKGKMRSIFTDSFETEGANWDDKMIAEFEKRRGYSLVPYLPYIILKVGHMGNPVNEKYGTQFSDAIHEDVINRVRNDFERLQIELFHENYIVPFNEWCHRNGTKSRVQAYGRGLHPIESSMYIDIPECETWLMGGTGVALGHEKDYWYGRGHSMINKFVASGAFLSGNNIVSCEELTNTNNVFNASLEEIKIIGDMSNLSGVNQSILHGFNYSPPQAGFPGWVKFGTYFSEQNTWWPYFKLWSDYKGRLSAIMQNSELQADIALLHPLEDMWSKLGQQRDPFPEISYPEYAHFLWEVIHQNGNGCDYVSENIIQQSAVRNGKLTFGPRSYSTIMLMEVESMEPATALMLENFAAKGGRIICIGKTPHQSIGLKDAAANDAKVKASINKIKTAYPDRFVVVDSPSGPLLEWYRSIQQKHNITPFVKIDKPDKFFSQNYYKQGDRDIFFLVNSHISQSADINVVFPAGVKGKQAWLWDAESGERYMLPASDHRMSLHFGPCESKLIVFDNDRQGKVMPADPVPCDSVIKFDKGRWNVTARHYDKTVRSFQMNNLADFNTLPFMWLKEFAGTLEYQIKFKVDNPADYHTLDAGITHNGVTELFINGESAGVKWYGDRKFNVSGRLKKGENDITIKVTTLLGNYIKAVDNPTARRFSGQRYRAIGLEGPVQLY